MSDLSVIEPTPLAVVQDGPGALLAAIMRIAATPGLQIDVLNMLLDRQEKMEAQQAERAYNAAMTAAQAEIQPVVRRSENKQTNSFYAKLEDVDKIIRPIYTKHGFSLSFNQIAPLTAGYVGISCRCAHTAGHSEIFYREAPADTMGPKGSPTKTALHGLGSSDTFLKRYIECGIFNVVLRNLDDDGVRGGMGFVSEAERDELLALIGETKTEEGRFLAVMCSDVRSIEEVEAKDFVRLKNALLQKKAQSLQKQAAREDAQ